MPPTLLDSRIQLGFRDAYIRFATGGMNPIEWKSLLCMGSWDKGKERRQEAGNESLPLLVKEVGLHIWAGTSYFCRDGCIWQN
jgi:hypothetical protein